MPVPVPEPVPPGARFATPGVVLCLPLIARLDQSSITRQGASGGTASLSLPLPLAACRLLLLLQQVQPLSFLRPENINRQRQYMRLSVPLQRRTATPLRHWQFVEGCMTRLYYVPLPPYRSDALTDLLLFRFRSLAPLLPPTTSSPASTQRPVLLATDKRPAVHDDPIHGPSMRYTDAALFLHSSRTSTPC